MREREHGGMSWPLKLASEAEAYHEEAVLCPFMHFMPWPLEFPFQIRRARAEHDPEKVTAQPPIAVFASL